MPSPPVIQQIAQAYQNDPRTKLAQVAMQTGSSGSPVAQGGWGYADGLARVLQGGLGGYIDHKQQKKYQKDENDLLAIRAKRAADLAGAPAIPAAQMAASFGAPPPVSPDPAMAPMPQTGMAPPSPQQGMAPPAPSQGPMSGPMPPQQSPQGAAAPFAPMQPSAPPMSAAQAPQEAPLAWLDPLGGVGRPTSGFGPRNAPTKGASTMHNGIDLAAPAGTPVAAASDGKVIRAWSDPKGGNSVLIRHPDGKVTGYAHLNDIAVQRGEPVKAGQPIGTVGRTGTATGDNLHFTVRDASGKRIDPRSIPFGEPQASSSASSPPSVAAASLPPAPAPVERPIAPQAQAATRSRTLDLAGRMASDGSRYESDDAQKLLERGLESQTGLDESAAERAQRIGEMGYSSDLAGFNQARGQDRGAAYDARSQATARQGQIEDREDNQSFNSTEAGRERAFRASESALARDASYKENLMKIEAAKGTADEKAERKKDAFMQTGHGTKAFQDAGAKIQANNAVLANLAEFSRVAKGKRTGGVVGMAFPALGIVNDTKWQQMDAISAELTRNLAKQLTGAISDKDVIFLQKSVPSLMRGSTANEGIIRRIEQITKRANQYQEAQWNALAAGDPTFITDWSKYNGEVPVNSDITYGTWKSMPVIKGR